MSSILVILSQVSIVNVCSQVSTSVDYEQKSYQTVNNVIINYHDYLTLFHFKVILFQNLKEFESYNNVLALTEHFKLSVPLN